MRDIFSPPSIQGEAQAGRESRAAKVRADIDRLKSDLGNWRWELASLFSEARQKSYHHDWGYADFDAFIDASNFDVGARECRYLIKINDISLQLGITREQLMRVAISKLKEIFSLDPATQGNHIETLVEEAVTSSLEMIRDEVRALKGTDPETELCWWNIRILRRAKETVIIPAIEKAKLEYGPTMSDTPGESAEISEGRAMEMVFADYLAQPDHYTEQLEKEANDE